MRQPTHIRSISHVKARAADILDRPAVDHVEDLARLARLHGALEEAENAVASGDFEDMAVDDLNGWLDALRPDARETSHQRPSAA